MDSRRKSSCLNESSIISHHPAPIRTRAALFSILLAAGFTLLFVCQSVESSTDQQQDQEDSQLRGQPNRQYFKVHLLSGSKANGSKKLLPKLKAARRESERPWSQESKLAAAGAASSPQAGADGGEPINVVAKDHSNKGQGKQTRQRGTISNATLKKLLHETLLKAPHNNTTSGSSATESQTNNSGQKQSKSNFKFVFIQRATAAPHSGSSAAGAASNSNNKNQPASSSTSTSEPTKATEATETSSQVGGEQQSTKPSLAASVSKQLATSLLHSAASLVANLSHSSPSLSSLASQIVAASAEAAANSIGDAVVLPTLNSKRRNNSTFSDSPAGGSAGELSESPNTRREQTGANESGSTPAAASAKKAPARKVTKSKPVKIYNLPVKFVANGQPNHVAVFHTLKEHFATIKRLQAMGSSNSSAGTKTVARLHKERKQQKHKLKGVNSRLIYLPLRYLSNAKPSKIMITGTSSSKATHKSSSAADS